MTRRITKTTLPDKTKVYCLDPDEAYIVYKQVSEYLQNGLTLKKGDVVFDVGANIGLFTIWLNNAFEGDIEIHAFEPIPDVYRILKLNTQKLDSKKIYPHTYGLSDSSRVVELGYFPNAPALSSMYPDDSEEEKMLMKNSILNNLNILIKSDAPFSLKIIKLMPKFLIRYLLGRRINKIFQIESIDCQMKTISDVINEYKIKRIDLLKIDVEKSELDVINGICSSDWVRIKQMVIEVHNIDNRLSLIKDCLYHNGFTTVKVVQEEAFQDSSIFCVYAMR